jgi:hypothetical protein
MTCLMLVPQDVRIVRISEVYIYIVTAFKQWLRTGKSSGSRKPSSVCYLPSTHADKKRNRDDGERPSEGPVTR